MKYPVQHKNILKFKILQSASCKKLIINEYYVKYISVLKEDRLTDNREFVNYLPYRSIITNMKSIPNYSHTVLVLMRLNVCVYVFIYLN